MNEVMDVSLWIKEFVSEEWNLKHIQDYLIAIHKLRKIRDLKEISSGLLIEQQLARCKEYREKAIKKCYKVGKRAKNGIK